MGDGPGARRSMHSVGRMFGLTFWENWYVIGESDPASGGAAAAAGTALAGGNGNGGFGVRSANAAAIRGRREGAATSTSLPPYKFIYYTGHTLQGNYEGAWCALGGVGVGVGVGPYR